MSESLGRFPYQHLCKAIDRFFSPLAILDFPKVGSRKRQAFFVAMNSWPEIARGTTSWRPENSCHWMGNPCSFMQFSGVLPKFEAQKNRARKSVCIEGPNDSWQYTCWGWKDLPITWLYLKIMTPENYDTTNQRHWFRCQIDLAWHQNHEDVFRRAPRSRLVRLADS